MTYKDYLRVIAHRLQCDTRTVKYVLHVAADVLGTMKEGEVTRTPFGGFHMCRKKPRPLLLPDGKTKVEVQEQLVVRLVPGKKLRRNKAAPRVWMTAEEIQRAHPELFQPEPEPPSQKESPETPEQDP